jgi:hypothetical protein
VREVKADEWFLRAHTVARSSRWILSIGKMHTRAGGGIRHHVSMVIETVNLNLNLRLVYSNVFHDCECHDCECHDWVAASAFYERKCTCVHMMLTWRPAR